jgi:molecular chaperone DnaK (HSP70)
VRRVAGESGIATAQLAELTRKRAQGVLPKAFGVGLQDDRDPDRHFVRHLAFANDPLPTGDRPLAAATVRDGQTEVEISVYQQQGTVLSEELEHNVQLTGGSGLITGIPPQPKGAPIDIVLSITEDGLLEVRARERSSGHELTISVVVGMSDADREAASRDTLAISVSS